MLPIHVQLNRKCSDINFTWEIMEKKNTSHCVFMYFVNKMKSRRESCVCWSACFNSKYSERFILWNSVSGTLNVDGRVQFWSSLSKNPNFKPLFHQSLPVYSERGHRTEMNTQENAHLNDTLLSNNSQYANLLL